MVPPPVVPPPDEPEPLPDPDPLEPIRELDDEGDEELLELLPGIIEDAVSRTCSTTRLITLRPRAVFAAAAAPAAAPAAAAAITVRRVRVLAAFFAAAVRFLAGGALLRGAAFLAAGRFFGLDFFVALRAGALRAGALRAALRAGAAFFFELFLLGERLLELLFFEAAFFEDFFEPFFDAIGSLLFNVSVGDP